MKHFLALLLLSSTWSMAHSQSELNLFYIDSSQPLSGDYFRQYELQYMENAILNVSDPAGLYLYYCDGDRSIFARNEDQRKKVMEMLYSGAGMPTQWDTDKGKLREYMYQPLKGFTGKLKMHLFLSDDKAWQIEQGESSVVKLLPKELHAVSGTALGQIEVTLYFDNESNRINTTKLKEVLEFYNNPEFAPVIIYQIEILKSK